MWYTVNFIYPKNTFSLWQENMFLWEHIVMKLYQVYLWTYFYIGLNFFPCLIVKINKVPDTPGGGFCRLAFFMKNRVLILFFTTTNANLGFSWKPTSLKHSMNCLTSWLNTASSCPSPTPSRKTMIRSGRVRLISLYLRSAPKMGKVCR